MNQEEFTPEEKQSIWMKNAGFLYDRLLVQKLKWPSLTFQWLPFRQESQGQTSYRFIYASHSSGNAQVQHLYISEVIFPELRDINEDPKNIVGSKIKNLFRFNHEIEINKARYNVENPDLIAARTDEGPVTIFKCGQEYPLTLLEGNLNGGFALDWKRQGLVTGDFNNNIFYWRNIEQTVPSQLIYGDKVEDTKWVDDNLIAIGADDGFLSLLDVRSNSIVQQVLTSNEEKKEVYCVSANPVQNHLILTGGEDSSVKLWDTRNLQIKLHKFEGHNGTVMNIDWSTINSSVFASGSTDSKVKIWDLMRVGFEIPKDLGGTDELLFTHEGHQGSVNDLGWNPFEMLLGSIDEDNNTLQVYQMSNNIHELEYAEDLQYLRQHCFG